MKLNLTRSRDGKMRFSIRINFRLEVADVEQHLSYHLITYGEDDMPKTKGGLKQLLRSSVRDHGAWVPMNVEQDEYNAMVDKVRTVLQQLCPEWYAWVCVRRCDTSPSTARARPTARRSAAGDR